MSIVGKRKPEPVKPVTAADILAQIEAKKAELRRLDRLAFDLAEKSVGNDEAEHQYHRCIEDSVAVQRDIERLQAALSGIEYRTAAAATTERAATRRGQLVEFEAQLQRRLAVVTELASAIETASKAYAAFTAETEKLAAYVPAGTSLSGFPIFDYLVDGRSFPVNLPMAIATEMFKTGQAPHLRLPGSKALTLELVDAPHLIESMVPAQQRVNDAMLADVRGQVERAEAAETEALAS